MTEIDLGDLTDKSHIEYVLREAHDQCQRNISHHDRVIPRLEHNLASAEHALSNENKLLHQEIAKRVQIETAMRAFEIPIPTVVHPA